MHASIVAAAAMLLGVLASCSSQSTGGGSLGSYQASIIGDPSCPTTIEGFHRECSVNKAVCDVTLTGPDEQVKLRYDCHFPDASRGVWFLALGDGASGARLCPAVQPQDRGTCDLPKGITCTYENKQCSTMAGWGNGIHYYCEYSTAAGPAFWMSRSSCGEHTDPVWDGGVPGYHPDAR